MTDRIQNMTVTLDQDYGDDDAEIIRMAIGMIKGVACVEFGKPVGPEDHFARQHAMMKLKEEMAGILKG